MKEDIINTTDVAVVLPENESTEATSTEAVLSDTQDQTEASEKRLYQQAASHNNKRRQILHQKP